MRITVELLKKMVDHAREEAPREACGIILGMEDRALKVLRAKNASETPEYTYSIDAEELLKSFEIAEKLGYEIIGFYHSHPHGSPVPSGIDLARAAWDRAYYVILNIKGEVRAWRWHEDKKNFIEESLVVE